MITTSTIVEHKDRLCRFGTNYMDLLLSRLGIRLEIVNKADLGRDQLMTDLVAIITSFAARLYGQRRAKRKTANFYRHITNARTRLSNIKNIVKHILISLILIY